MVALFDSPVTNNQAENPLERKTYAKRSWSQIGSVFLML
jgi:hypothetical protein